MTQSMTHPEAMYLYLAVLYYLTWFSQLHRLLSLCPVLLLGYPDMQTYRCSTLWFLLLEVKNPHCGTALFCIFTQSLDLTDPMEDLYIHQYLESS